MTQIVPCRVVPAAPENENSDAIEVAPGNLRQAEKYAVIPAKQRFFINLGGYLAAGAVPLGMVVDLVV